MAHTPTLAEQSAALIRDCTNIRARWAVVCGSGLSGVADMLEDQAVFPYESLFGFESPEIIGHPGRLVLGRMGDAWCAVFQGRTHLYEGKGVAPTLAAVRLAHALRIRNICITNAAGALRPPLGAGWLMPFTGHMNMTFFEGNTLAQTRTLRTGVYDPALRAAFVDAALGLGAPAHPGCTPCSPGPRTRPLPRRARTASWARTPWA